jgi:uncharacterized protein YlaI
MTKTKQEQVEVPSVEEIEDLIEKTHNRSEPCDECIHGFICDECMARLSKAIHSMINKEKR